MAVFHPQPRGGPLANQDPPLARSTHPNSFRQPRPPALHPPTPSKKVPRNHHQNPIPQSITNQHNTSQLPRPPKKRLFSSNTQRPRKLLSVHRDVVLYYTVSSTQKAIGLHISATPTKLPRELIKTMSTPRILSLFARALPRTPRTLTASPRTILRAAPRRLPLASRLYSSSTPTSAATPAQPAEDALSHLSPAEHRIHTTLSEGLTPSSLHVQDISGGCGSMFAIEVASSAFSGVGMLAQQRMVNKLLKEQMDEEGWHGVQIKTSATA